MTTKTLLAAGAAAAALILGATQAQANVILSEDFNSPAFLASGGFGFAHFSDRWANTYYHYPAASANGWTVSGTGVFVASNLDDELGDQAILLNEFAGSKISRSLTGLTSGVTYNVSFLYWGDNIVGSPWALGVDVGAANYALINGVDLAPGTNPGTIHNFSFVASGATETLSFYELSQSGASPIIDNVLVTGPGAAVPEPASWALMIGGFGMAGAAMRRRRALMA